jgi:glyoxylase-like metal-dependent hydrolase (beta-lactamase superfamily II)
MAPDDSTHGESGLILHRFENSICSSNTYVFFPAGMGSAWVIDPGDAAPVVACLRNAGRALTGILVTHSHHDHIYGITDMQSEFPAAKVYAAKASVEGFFSAKLNMSRYYLRPFCVTAQEITCVAEGSRIPFSPGLDITVVEAPGHHPGSVCFSVMNQLFTGDALLPGVRITTVLPGGDRELAKRSVRKLLAMFGTETLIHPGHGDGCRLGLVDFEGLFQRAGTARAQSQAQR